MVQISQNGLNLIKSFEAFEPTMYLDSAGKPTIGYGTLITDSNIHLLDAEISEAYATQLLMEHVKDDARTINNALKVPINQNQADALFSFVYNLGRGAFLSSTLLKRINRNDSIESIKNEFLRWKYVTVNGVKKELRGLLNRRKDEAALYASEMLPSKKKPLA